MLVIQIGTNNGNDHVLELCKKINPDRILLVEPFDIHNHSIEQNYKDVNNYKIYNCAIVPNNNIDKIKIYYCLEDGPEGHPNKSFQVTSIIPHHIIKHGYRENSLKHFEVDALTINKFLEQNNCFDIDYLFLDIEGIDYEILESIDFNKFNIKSLQIEKLHIDYDKLIKFMTEKGYTAHNSLDWYGFDIMFKKN